MCDIQNLTRITELMPPYDQKNDLVHTGRTALQLQAAIRLTSTRQRHGNPRSQVLTIHEVTVYTTVGFTSILSHHRPRNSRVHEKGNPCTHESYESFYVVRTTTRCQSSRLRGLFALGSRDFAFIGSSHFPPQLGISTYDHLHFHPLISLTSDLQPC